MKDRALESALKKLGRRHRLDRLLAPFGLLGLLIGGGVLVGKLPIELTYLAGFGILLFGAPVSVRRTAQTLNQKNGDDPDMLCAVEHLNVDRPSVQALQARCLQTTWTYLNGWRLGWRWLWIGCALVWCVPSFVSSSNVWSVSDLTRSLSVPAHEDEYADMQKGDVSNAVPLAEAVKNKENTQEQSSQPPTRKVPGKGKLAALEGAKSPKTVPRSAASVEGRSSMALPGRGVGVTQTPGKLTETANPGTVELLSEDQLDPSEKYPVEYHEAIREWFLKRRN